MVWFEISGIVLAGALGLGVEQAQETPVPAPAPAESAAPAGPDWRIVSRSTDRFNLIDVNSLSPADDAVTVRVARVRSGTPAGDYRHAVNLFAVRCRGNELHLIEESEIAADGVTADTYPVDEPWLPVVSGTADEGIKTIACEEGDLAGPGFPSIRAFIDTGRR